MSDIELTPEYQKGFNDGYLIAKHLPELSEKLADIKDETPALKGLKDGRDEFVREFEKSRYPEWLRSDRFAKKEKNDKDKGKEKDGLDKE